MQKKKLTRKQRRLLRLTNQYIQAMQRPAASVEYIEQHLAAQGALNYEEWRMAAIMRRVAAIGQRSLGDIHDYEAAFRWEEQKRELEQSVLRPATGAGDEISDAGGLVAG